MKSAAAIVSNMKPGMRLAVRIGTIVTASVALLPYLRDFFLTAFLAGALAAVWFAIRKCGQRLEFKDGAQLGFLSGFYGLLLASGIYDLIWETFHYRLWRIENIDRILALAGEALHNVSTIHGWIMITLQIVIAAICAGAFGAPSGILGVKIFRRS